VDKIGAFGKAGVPVAFGGFAGHRCIVIQIIRVADLVQNGLAAAAAVPFVKGFPRRRGGKDNAQVCDAVKMFQWEASLVPKKLYWKIQ
jgi:hypothetical protein